MRALVTLLLAVTVLGCGDTVINNVPNNQPSNTIPTLPTPNNPLPNPVSRIEYRVNGNATSARIRYSNANDGLIQVVTALPYVAVVTSNESTMFLALEATPTNYPANVVYPFISVQIFANGLLFREAASDTFFLGTLTVSGTWRR